MSHLWGWDDFVPSEATGWELFLPAVNSLPLRPASCSTPVAIQGSGKHLPFWSLGAAALCHPTQDSRARLETCGADSQEHLTRLELGAVIKAAAHKSQSYSPMWFWDHGLPVEMRTQLEALHICHHKAGWPFSNQALSRRCPVSPPPPAPDIH